MLSLLTLGNGDAFSRDRYSTALLLEHTAVPPAGEASTGKPRTTRLLIDSPHPIRKMLAEADPSLDIHVIDALILTHLHGDHASGVEGLAFAFHFGLRRKLPLLAHPDVAGPLWPTKLESSMDTLLQADGTPGPKLTFEDYFEHTPLSTEHVVDFGPFRIEVRLTRHHIPTYAFRVFTDQGSFGYSADTAWDSDLYHWLAECDLVVHETNLGPAHTPYADLCALPENLRLKTRLVAWHDGLKVEGGPIAPLHPGERFVIAGG